MKKYFIMAMICFGINLYAQEDTINQIYQTMRNGELTTAESMAKELIEKNPERPDAYHVLGRIYHAQKRYEESIRTLEKSLSFQRQPTWMIGWSYTFLGFDYKEMGEKEKAVEFLQKAIQLNATRNCVNAAAGALRELGVKIEPEIQQYRLSMEGEKAPTFELTDVYGQTHRLEDYAGLPMVVHIGATWCGGCQQEAEWMERLAETFLPKGVVFMTLCPGENEAAVMDYLKHYRSKGIGLIDFRYEVSRQQFRAPGWPVTMVIGADGTVVYHNIGASRDDGKIREILQEQTMDLDVERVEGKVKPYCKDGVCYLPIERRSGPPGDWDYLPRTAFDGENRLWVTFTSNRDGDNNVYLRCYEKGGKKNDLCVTQTIADDYSSDIAITGNGTIWLTWVSDREGKYDIYCRTYREGDWSKELRISRSEDDAFRPRLAIADSGDVWVTYYKWNRQFNDISRDRDLFARYFDGSNWSKEFEVSPPEPKVEDHTDPAIVIDSENKAWIAWSYDYHPQLFDKPLDTDQPSIFIRRLGSTGPEGDYRLIGTRRQSLHAVDLFPSLALGPKNELWCAWDAFMRNGRSILVSCREPETNMFGPEMRVSQAGELVSTPSICVDGEGTPIVVWSQWDKEKWSIFGSRYENERWGKAVEIIGGQENRRNVQALVDGEKRVWVVCESQAGVNTQLIIRKME